MKLNNRECRLRRSALAFVCSLGLVLTMTPAAFADTKAKPAPVPVTAEDILSAMEEKPAPEESVLPQEVADADIIPADEGIEETEELDVQSSNFNDASKAYYTVRYIASPVTSGYTFSRTYAVGASMKLPGAEWRRSGYTLYGWSYYRNPFSVNYYKNETKSRGIGSRNGQVINLYPCWVANTYYIYYNLNGGKNGPYRTLYRTAIPTTLATKIPYRKGYIFRGWSLAPQASRGMNAGSRVSFSYGSNITLYATWKKI